MVLKTLLCIFGLMFAVQAAETAFGLDAVTVALIAKGGLYVS